MKKSIQSLIYNFLSFAVLFFSMRYIVAHYTNLQGIWVPVTAAVVGTILAPKFQAVKTNEGEKLFMSWIFIKGLKEIK
jgi:hypothetical protein